MKATSLPPLLPYQRAIWDRFAAGDRFLGWESRGRPRWQLDEERKRAEAAKRAAAPVETRGRTVDYLIIDEIPLPPLSPSISTP